MLMDRKNEKTDSHRRIPVSTPMNRIKKIPTTIFR
jgi:hypothetical protein